MRKAEACDSVFSDVSIMGLISNSFALFLALTILRQNLVEGNVLL